MLETALVQYERFHRVLRFDLTLASLNARINQHFDVIKLLVPHCKSFDVTAITKEGNYITMPSVEACFMTASIVMICESLIFCYEMERPQTLVYFMIQRKVTSTTRI